MKPEQRHAFLFSMTLTELVLILFFLLLLLSSWRLKKADEAQQTIELAQTLLHDESLRALLAYREENPDEDFRRLVRVLENPKLREVVEYFEEDPEAKLSALAEAADAAREIRGELARLRATNRNLSGQVQNLRRRTGSGFGLPPCWTRPDGSIEYLFRVTVKEEDLDAEPILPPHRLAEFEAIPGAPALPGSSLRPEEFQRRAEAILAWSKRQDPECRHYVRIVDRAQTKNGYKQKRLLIENYFYKYEER